MSPAFKYRTGVPPCAALSRYSLSLCKYLKYKYALHLSYAIICKWSAYRRIHLIKQYICYLLVSNTSKSTVAAIGQNVFWLASVRILAGLLETCMHVIVVQDDQLKRTSLWRNSRRWSECAGYEDRCHEGEHNAGVHRDRITVWLIRWSGFDCKLIKGHIISETCHYRQCMCGYCKFKAVFSVQLLQ